ncbi:MAG: Lrp/AsnC ligand binding domain-containing protein [Candidatus Thermoplasmatota archaeon]|nr:Lrp/AsnC ligand binding domain-containing protein [Candidatus Thermoplasmatota archaeon]MCL5888539.1 Lrp/AsnC ligand binding domain-containing protein [Candidatus Thermoplasmatota archaeon]
MQNSGLDVELDRVFDRKIVTALVGVRVEINRVENIAAEMVSEPHVEDVFVVTGEFDIIVKVRFPDYNEFQKYILNKLSKISGVRNAKTMMVVSIKKENKRVFVE